MGKPLSPKQAGKLISQASKYINISQQGVQKTASNIFAMMKAKPDLLSVDRWNLHELNPKGGDQQAVDWIFVSDVLNFSFFPDDPDKKYTKIYNGKPWTGFWSLIAAMNKAKDEGIPITDPQFYATVTRDQLDAIFSSDSPYAMPLMEERLSGLHEAGKVLVQKYDGSFVNVIKSCNNSAQTLLELVVKEFPSFNDIAEFEGQTVAIYKRAQILIADIWACCGGKGFGEFHDIDTITMFADYRIPQMLVWFGVLEYNKELQGRLAEGTFLENGSQMEVEIRGCSIEAVERLVEEIRKLAAADASFPRDVHVNAVLVDHFLWDYRRERAQDTDSVAFHRTRCIYY